MNLNLLFPTVIGQIKNKNFTDKVKPIAHSLLVKSNPNFWNYHSSYSDKNISDELNNHDFIYNYIKNISFEFLDKNGYKIPSEIEIEMFVSRMKKGEGHGRHRHPKAILSGVCYLTIEEGSAPIRFYNNDFKQWLGIEIKNNTLYNQYHNDHFPEEGDILIWESWVDHEVVSNYHLNGIRETLVFNVGINKSTSDDT
jgi:uncharacterized protein (TIGR02466 family)